MAGGMMRFGIPQYRLPRDVLDAEVQTDPRPRRRARAESQGRQRRSTRCARAASTPPSSRSAPTSASRAYIPAGEAAADHRRGLAAGEHGGRGEAAARPAGRRLRRRQHRDGRGAHRQAAGRDRGGRRLPPHPRADARPRLRGRGGRRGGRDDEVAVDDQARRGRQARCSSGWSSTRPASRSRPARLEELEADSLVLALGQEADLSLLDGVPGIEIDDGVVAVGPNMMTGHAGIFAGGDMVPAERTVTVGVGHGKKAARNIDGWLRDASTPRPRSTTWSSFDTSTPGTTPTRRARVQPQLEAARRRFDLRRGRRRPRRVERPVRGAPLPVVRQLLLVRQLLRRLPRQRGDQARRPGRAVRDRPRLLQGLRPLRRRVSLRRDRDGPGGDLISDQRSKPR